MLNPEITLRRRRAVLGYLLIVMSIAFAVGARTAMDTGTDTAIVTFMFVWLAALNAFWAGQRSVQP